MRKILIAVFATILFLGVTPNTQAQGFEKGKIYLDLGIGAPRYSYGGTAWAHGNYNYNTTRTPSFRASVRYGFNEFISGGVYVGFAQHKWSVITKHYEAYERTRYIPVGVGASFHVWSFLNNTLDLGLGVENLDLYVTLTTGAQIRAQITAEVEKFHPYTNSDTRRVRVSPFFGSMVGGRYFFLDRMGAYVQFGYGMNSYVEGGLTFKF